MRRAIAMILALFLFAKVVPAWPASAADGSCASCHSGEHATAALEHDFSDWIQSPHAKSGVSCEACHGGDSSRPDKGDAHAGILRSTDPKSRLYFTRIPETCGSCHASEFGAFKKSLHYKELQRNGRGPNCVTCHGSMANHVIDPKDMEMTCNLCHRQPTNAYSARMTVLEARTALHRLNDELQQARKTGEIEIGAQERTYRDQLERLRGVMVDWHSFDMKQVQSETQQIIQQASSAYTDLKIKGRKP